MKVVSNVKCLLGVGAVILIKLVFVNVERFNHSCVDCAQSACLEDFKSTCHRFHVNVNAYVESRN